MSISVSYRPSLLASKRLIGALIAIAAVALIVVSGAMAASYQYCNGCTINSGSYKLSANHKYSSNNYVHRLSGPGGPLVIGSQALRYSDGNTQCYNTSTTTEVSCNPGGVNVFGAAHNGGAGNYSFNAHLTY